jgi:hypothetical protein
LELNLLLGLRAIGLMGEKYYKNTALKNNDWKDIVKLKICGLKHAKIRFRKHEVPTLIVYGDNDMAYIRTRNEKFIMQLNCLM